MTIGDRMKQKILITGGAGFIGSHLAENLFKRGHDVIVIDNFSTGKWENLVKIKDKIRIIEGDLRDFNFVLNNVKDIDLIFHLAANYSVAYSSKNPIFDFESNVLTTLHVLEAMRKNNISKIVFTSSSTVYGETEKLPIPEDAELKPINNYGASKVCAETYIHSFSNLYGINGLILRYANIMGSRAYHGVVPDFVRKLKKNKKKLLILGDGKQKKSYLYVTDCIDATLIALKNFKRGFSIFNIGSDEWMIVDDIARIVCNEMGLKDVIFEYKGGERGWSGDVRKFILDITKIKNLGWRPRYNIEQSVKKTLKWLKVTI